jgi:hypothetical protein
VPDHDAARSIHDRRALTKIEVRRCFWERLPHSSGAQEKRAARTGIYFFGSGGAQQRYLEIAVGKTASIAEL